MLQQAVILAGGEGTRLRPITYEIPKPLVPVQGWPIIQWQTHWLTQAGIKDILIIVPQKRIVPFKDWRVRWMRESADTDVRIELWPESEPLGTLGAIAHNLRDRFQAPFIVTNGDELKGLNLLQLIAFHEKQRQEITNYGATIALVEVPDPRMYGVAICDGPLIASFLEKPENPPSRFISSGLYIIEPSALDVVSDGASMLMFEKDLFPKLADARILGGCPLTGPWFDCGTLTRREDAITNWPGDDLRAKSRQTLKSII